MKTICKRCGVEANDHDTNLSWSLLEGTELVTCPSCTDTLREAAWQTLCPPLYQGTKSAMLNQEKLAEVMKWEPGARGLLIHGPTASGKTRMAWLLLREKAPPDLKFFDAVSFGHELSRQYRSDTAEDWLDEVANCGLVFFDDLGKLKLTERAEAELFGVIERRVANLKPIIATTNDTGETLSERMSENRGPAMIRRLREFCDVVSL